MIKETFTLFLSHQQQTLENEQSIDYNNQQQTEVEREIHAVEVVQVNYHNIYSIFFIYYI